MSKEFLPALKKITTENIKPRMNGRKLTLTGLGLISALGACEGPRYPMRSESIDRECLMITSEEDRKVRLPNGDKVWVEDTDAAFRSRTCIGDYSDSTYNTSEPDPIGTARQTYEKYGQ